MVDENEDEPVKEVSEEGLPEAEDVDEEVIDPLAGPALNEFGDPIEE